jgi:hypothetical protein
MLISHRMHDIALHLMYESVTMSSSSYSSFLHTLNAKPGYSSLIRTLHLQDFPPALESELPKLLSSCSLLRTLSIPLGLFHIDVFQVFLSRHLDSLELVHHKFGMIDYKTSFLQSDLAGLKPAVMYPLSSLSLENLNLVGGNILETLLSRCPNLRTLEFYGCQFNHGTLSYLHKNARITEFTSYVCGGIKVEEVVDLLREHPAIKDSLERFNFWDQHDMHPKDIADIVRNLPPTLRFFRLTGGQTTREQIPMFQRLSRQLEEMNIRRGLSLRDVEEIILGSWYDLGKSNYVDTSGDEIKRPSGGPHQWTAGISNVVALSQLVGRFSSVALKSGTSVPQLRLRELDLREMSISTKQLLMSLLLSPYSKPLAIIQLPFDFVADLRDLTCFCDKAGWNVKSSERRVWIERKSMVNVWPIQKV